MWKFLSGACRCFKRAGSAQLSSTYGDVLMTSCVLKGAGCAAQWTKTSLYSRHLCIIPTFPRRWKLGSDPRQKHCPTKAEAKVRTAVRRYVCRLACGKKLCGKEPPSTAFIFIYIHCNKLQYVRVRAAVLLDGETNFTQRDFFRFFILKPISFKMINLKRV